MTAFAKPAQTAQQQRETLVERGLAIQDTVRADRLLEVVTLFRLSPYMRVFQDGSPEHCFVNGATLNAIHSLYQFDSELRQLVMRGVERIEVAARSVMSNELCTLHKDPHWYVDPEHFSRRYRHDRLLNDLEKQLDDEKAKLNREIASIENSRSSQHLKQRRIESRTRDNYIRYYSQTYTAPVLPPFWAAVETMSLGSVSHLFQGLGQDRARKLVATRFAVPQVVLESWLHTLTFVRNICAHHGRLWNRELAIPPKWPHTLAQITGIESKRLGRRFFTIAMILTYLNQIISPDSRWLTRLEILLEQHPEVDLNAMGFPENWHEQLLNIANQAALQTEQEGNEP